MGLMSFLSSWTNPILKSLPDSHVQGKELQEGHMVIY